jgi:DUF4097 and DUF4098 domain-containing protein YvlB
MGAAGRRRPVPALILGVLILTVPTAGCEESMLGPGGDGVIDEPFTFLRDAAGVTSFRLTGVNGDVTVTGQSVGDAFVATGSRRIEGCSQEAAEEWIDELEVRVTMTAEEITVETLQPVDTSPCTLVVDYELRVPDRLIGEIVNVNGRIDISGLRQGVAVTNVNGPVTLEDVEGSTTVLLTNGNITASLAIDGEETIDLLTVNGGIDLSIPMATSATLSAILVNGSISVSNLTLFDVSSTQTSLTATLGDGLGEVVLRTTNGGIAVTGE